MKKAFLIFIILLCCGKPATEIKNNNLYKNKEITLEVVFKSNIEKIDNVFTLIIPPPKNESVIFLEKGNSIKLNSLSYGESQNLIFSIDDWIDLEICYSPSANDFERIGNLSGIILFEYNYVFESIQIIGDSIKDIHINIKEKAVDYDYWIRNDKSIPESCK